MKVQWSLLLTALLIAGCSSGEKKSDAYGNFEAVETIVASEAPGKLLFFDVEEGRELASAKVVGCVDTVQLYLKRLQLMASKQSIASRSANVIAQMEVLKEQKNVALIEKSRIENLFREKVATQKQMDDVNGQISVLDKQMLSIESQNAAVLSEWNAIDAQIRQIDDQIKKSVVTNPVTGTVLNKFVQAFEIVSFGKPLYKIADLSSLNLRVYVSGDQLAHIAIGQKVQVLIDETKTANRPLEGEIIWIASKAEFTPKIIQTKDERVNLVYAVKVRVANDGSLKIGMPGEVNFNIMK